MASEIRDAIEAADATALRALLAAEPRLADADVRFGENDKHAVPPLHYVCDVVFRGLATQEQALAMADVLLEAGVDPARSYAKSGDTFLIAAASLGAEGVGLRLVERGVAVTPRGLFGAVALHWAALMGLERLARALLDAGAELEPVDSRYDRTPLQWALHAWNEGTSGRREGLPPVASLFVERGARVPASALAALTKDSDAPMRAALSGGSPRPDRPRP